MTNEPMGLEAILENRNAMYRFLSGMFIRECNTAYLENMAETEFPVSGNGLIIEGYRKIRLYLDTQHDDMREELACDYAKVFLGAGVYDGRSASPYESVYTSEEGLLMQEARDDVYRVFLEEGILPVAGEDDGHIPEDHISFELEFMAYCGSVALDALRAQDDAVVIRYLDIQNEFLANHLSNWVPRLCADGRELCRTGFYEGICDITEGFLCDDAEFLADLREYMSIASYC